MIYLIGRMINLGWILATGETDQDKERKARSQCKYVRDRYPTILMKKLSSIQVDEDIPKEHHSCQASNKIIDARSSMLDKNVVQDMLQEEVLLERETRFYGLAQATLIVA